MFTNRPTGSGTLARLVFFAIWIIIRLLASLLIFVFCFVSQQAAYIIVFIRDGISSPGRPIEGASSLFDEHNVSRS